MMKIWREHDIPDDYDDEMMRDRGDDMFFSTIGVMTIVWRIYWDTLLNHNTERSDYIDIITTLTMRYCDDEKVY